MLWGEELNGWGGEAERGEVPAPSEPPPSHRHFLRLARLSARWSDHGSPSPRCQAAAWRPGDTQESWSCARQDFHLKMPPFYQLKSRGSQCHSTIYSDLVGSYSLSRWKSGVHTYKKWCISTLVTYIFQISVPKFIFLTPSRSYSLPYSSKRLTFILHGRELFILLTDAFNIPTSGICQINNHLALLWKAWFGVFLAF